MNPINLRDFTAQDLRELVEWMNGEEEDRWYPITGPPLEADQIIEAYRTEHLEALRVNHALHLTRTVETLIGHDPDIRRVVDQALQDDPWVTATQVVEIIREARADEARRREQEAT